MTLPPSPQKATSASSRCLLKVPFLPGWRRCGAKAARPLLRASRLSACCLRAAERRSLPRPRKSLLHHTLSEKGYDRFRREILCGGVDRGVQLFSMGEGSRGWCAKRAGRLARSSRRRECSCALALGGHASSWAQGNRKRGHAFYHLSLPDPLRKFFCLRTGRRDRLPQDVREALPPWLRGCIVTPSLIQVTPMGSSWALWWCQHIPQRAALRAHRRASPQEHLRRRWRRLSAACWRSCRARG